MIEVEKKFLLSDIEKTQLLNGAEFLYEKLIADTYFDDSDYSLTKADLWLRARNGEYELKAPLKSGSHGSAKRYHELTNEVAIAERLNIGTENVFADELKLRGIAAFVTCRALRQSYMKDGFTIDIDSATYENSDFTYDIAEIELLVEDESETDSAEARIVTFAQKHNINTDAHIRGKIPAYLQHVNPEHYAALVATAVL